MTCEQMRDDFTSILPRLFQQYRLARQDKIDQTNSGSAGHLREATNRGMGWVMVVTSVGVTLYALVQYCRSRLVDLGVDHLRTTSLLESFLEPELRDNP